MNKSNLTTSIISLTLLKKIQELISVSIELISIDISTSLYMNRKILEIIVNNFYEINDIKKAKTANGYPTLFVLVKKMKEEELAPSDIISAMERVRDFGNLAVHEQSKKFVKPEAIESLKNLCGILVWFLEINDSKENSLYLLSLRRGNQVSSKLLKTEFPKKLDKSLKNIFSLSPIANNKRITNELEELTISKIIDKQLVDYITSLDEIVKKYEKWNYEFDASDYKEDFIISIYKRIAGYKKGPKPTPGKMFKEFYKDEIITLNEKKKLIQKKYKYSP